MSWFPVHGPKDLYMWYPSVTYIFNILFYVASKNETTNSTVCIHPLHIFIYLSQYTYFFKNFKKKKKKLVYFVFLQYVIVKYTGIKAVIVVT